ncbi:hypothetical protein [Paenibacillus terreus]|uniref:hypothetical protein n=1 Tax=Paenibacillus terreus TaxID=1387834 RepID=UPI0035CD2607
MLEDFLRDLLDLPPSERDELLALNQHLMKDRQIKIITKKLTQITDDTGMAQFTREDTLNRISRYVESAKNHIRKDDNGLHLPKASQFMIVRVNFAGLGTELDDVHYAIVWEEHRKRDNISVIPTTSFKPESTLETGLTFNIGHVDFLGGETVVLMDQIISISRKRLQAVRHYNHGTGRREIAKLSKDQQLRIKDGFRIYGLHEATLFNEFIRDSFKDTLPEFQDPDVQFDHLHRPVITIQNTKDELIYQLYNDTRQFTISRKLFAKPGVNRYQLLIDWINAKAEVDRATLEIVKSREEVRKEGYAKIQAAIEAWEQPSGEDGLTS